MNITVIAEHSVCLDLLPDEALILDGGCRGFEFTNYFRERKHVVMPLDIDTFDPAEGYYLLAALGTTTGHAKILRGNDPQGFRITNFVPRQVPFTLGPDEIEVMPIWLLENIMGQKFDLIKLDIEGEEVPILRAALHPIAKQVSVEFHAHCTSQTKESLDDLLQWLSQWYTVHNAVWESRHGAGFNYWDVLLIAK